MAVHLLLMLRTCGCTFGEVKEVCSCAEAQLHTSPHCASLCAFSTKKVKLPVRKFRTALHMAARCKRGRTFPNRGSYLGFLTALLNCN